MRIKYGYTPRVQTPVAPDGPGLLGGDDGVDGLGVDGLATGCRVG
jgi:hypothetical protein